MNEIDKAKELILLAKKFLDESNSQSAYKAQHELNGALRTLSNAKEFKPELRLAIAY